MALHAVASQMFLTGSYPGFAGCYILISDHIQRTNARRQNEEKDRITQLHESERRSNVLAKLLPRI